MKIKGIFAERCRRDLVCFPGLLLVAFMMIAGGGMTQAQPAAAQQNALKFNGKKDYVVIDLSHPNPSNPLAPWNPSFTAGSFTIMARVAFSSFDSPTNSHRAIARGVEFFFPSRRRVHQHKELHFIAFPAKNGPDEVGIGYNQF